MTRYFFVVCFFGQNLSIFMRMNWWSMKTIKMANRKSEQERRAWCAVFCVFVVAVFDLKTSKKCYSCCWHFAILWPFTLGVMGPIKWKFTWVCECVCVCKSHSYFFCFRLFESRSPFIFSGVDSKSLSLSFCARHFGCCSFLYIIIIKKIVIITCMRCVAVALWVCVYALIRLLTSLFP